MLPRISPNLPLTHKPIANRDASSG
jgi:hypothetical protein